MTKQKQTNNETGAVLTRDFPRRNRSRFMKEAEHEHP